MSRLAPGDNGEVSQPSWCLCPDCGLLAEITGRYVLESTSGRVPHVKVLCVNRHFHSLPADQIQEGP